MSDPVSVLVYTSLYPNKSQPGFGVFVENRISRVAETGEADIRVVAPVPWFPFAHAKLGRYGQYAGIPKCESRLGLEITHPRYPLVPKISMNLAPWLLYRWTLPHVKRMIVDGFVPDIVDAHYAYPDGVAAVMLARSINLPVMVTARGSDLNVLPNYPVPRRWLRWMVREADHLAGVSQPLADRFLALGAPPENVSVLRNGVDLAQFSPSADPGDLSRTLRLQSTGDATILSAGNLIELKGHDLVIKALARHIPNVNLLVAGDGPLRKALEALTVAEGVSDRVRFLGRVPYDRMPGIMAASDILVLASSSEGWPNVLLEAMATGTPVAATNVGAVGDIVTSPVAGRIIADRTVTGCAEAIKTILASPPDRTATRKHAERYSWDATTQTQLSIWRSLRSERNSRRSVNPVGAANP